MNCAQLQFPGEYNFWLKCCLYLSNRSMMDSAWILYSPVKCWLLLQFFLHLWLSKSLLPRQQFALKIKNLITSYVFFIFIKLDWNQAAGSTVIGGRDLKLHRQTDYMHSVYIIKKNKIKFSQFDSWNYNHSVTLQHSFHSPSLLMSFLAPLL